MIKLSQYSHIRSHVLWHDLLDLQIPLTSPIEKFLIEHSQSFLNEDEIPFWNWNDADAKLFRYLIQNGLIVSADTKEDGLFYPHRVDIETVSHCNARCTYCPQSLSPKPKAVMAMSIFAKLLERLKPYSPKWIALNHYGEPLLDPFFNERVNMMSEQNHKLFLFTNGVFMTEDLLHFLSHRLLHGVGINFPSLEPLEWARMMRLSQANFSRTLHQIESAVSLLSGKVAQLEILINNIDNDQSGRVDRIRGHFDHFGEVNIIKWGSHSRAGSIENSQVYCAQHNNQASFWGCERIVGQLHVSVTGDCFLCCQDYFQKYQFGNIVSHSIDDIMRHGAANELRAEIYGSRKMITDRICRKCVRLRLNRHEV